MSTFIARPYIAISRRPEKRLTVFAFWSTRSLEFPRTAYGQQNTKISTHFFNLDTDLTMLAGIPIARIANVVGWEIANGAAPGFVGDFWLEFGKGAPLAIAAVGWIYGKFWRRARTNPAIQPVYIIFAALSIYLITQTIDAWLFRCLLYAGTCMGNPQIFRRP